MKKYVKEESKKIPKNIGGLIEDEEQSILENEDEDNFPEDLVSMTKRTNNAFYKGNGNVSQDDYSPEDILREYQEFN